MAYTKKKLVPAQEITAVTPTPTITTKPTSTPATTVSDEGDDFSAELIKQINKEAGNKIAFNLTTDDAPTVVKRWISTGSKQLDYIIKNGRDGGVPEGRIVEIQGPASCHAAGTPVLKHDGTTILVEDVKPGMTLLGPDSKPRLVKSVHSGTDEMFQVTPHAGGVPFVVNGKHILSLKRASNGKRKSTKRVGEVVSVTVKDYLSSSRTFKKQYKLYRSGLVEFGAAPSNLPIPPYVLGLLLGDGSLSEKRIELTTADKEIAREYTNYCNSLGYEVSVHNFDNNKSYGIYHKNNIRTGKKLEQDQDKDAIRYVLRELKLLGTNSGNKFVPQQYKTASTHSRLELLAGLIDTDGVCCNKKQYEYCSKSKRLAEDFSFVARSLGMVATISHKMVNGTLYYRVYLCGDEVKKIPTRLSRKKIDASVTSRKNFNLTGFSVKPVGVGQYYGFEVDSDHLFLSEDFIVHHNSGKTHIAYEICKSCQRMGGVVVYVDSENATSLENLISVGINVKKRFLFIQETCMEQIFKVIESTIEKARNMKSDVPVVVVWDSVAASAPKAEIDGDYDQNTIGLAARVLSKGFRKITHVIGDKNVALVLINQQRTKIGCVSPETVIQYRKVQ